MSLLGCCGCLTVTFSHHQEDKHSTKSALFDWVSVKQRFIAHLDVHQASNGKESALMPWERVPPALLEAIKSLEPFVDSFVPCARNGIKLLHLPIQHGTPLSFNPLSGASVTPVSNHFLSKMSQNLSEAFSENLGVWPPPSTKWAMDPENLGTTGSNADFVPQRRSI